MPRNEGTRASDVQRKAEREVVQFLALQPLPKNLLVERMVLYFLAFVVIGMGGGAWSRICFVVLTTLLVAASAHAQSPPLVSVLPALVMPIAELGAVAWAPKGSTWEYGVHGWLRIPLWIFPLWGLAAHCILDLQRLAFRVDTHLPSTLRRSRFSAVATHSATHQFSEDASVTAMNEPNGKPADATV